MPRGKEEGKGQRGTEVGNAEDFELFLETFIFFFFVKGNWVTFWCCFW